MVKQRLRIHHPSKKHEEEDDEEDPHKIHLIDPYNFHQHNNNNNEYVPEEFGSTFSSPSLFDVESQPNLESIPNNNNNKNNKKRKTKKKKEKIIFRSIQPSDREMIQQLHEEWFPVRYQSEFYDDLVHGKMYPTGDPLYTKVAVVVVIMGDDDDDDDDESENDRQDLDTIALSGSSRTPPYYPNDRIVACIVATMVPAHRLNRASRELLLPHSFQGGRRTSTVSSTSTSTSSTASACYIMTLGTVLEYRQYGLATTLVEQCIQEMVLPLPSCGALYLHVLTTNRAAIRFYEQDRLQFYRVTELFNYYVIDQEQYNCYLYAKYFHGTLQTRVATHCPYYGPPSLPHYCSPGNRGHLDIFQILAWWVFRLWSRIKEPLLFFWLKQRQHQHLQQHTKRISRGGRRDEQDSPVDRHKNYLYHNHGQDDDDDDSVSLE